MPVAPLPVSMTMRSVAPLPSVEQRADAEELQRRSRHRALDEAREDDGYRSDAEARTPTLDAHRGRNRLVVVHLAGSRSVERAALIARCSGASQGVRREEAIQYVGSDVAEDARDASDDELAARQRILEGAPSA